MSIELDPGFTTMLDDAKTQSQLMGDYLRGKTEDDNSTYYQRHWMIPSRAGTFVPTDIPNLGTAFNRRDLNSDYGREFTASRGMVGNNIARGLELNYMAMWERSFRERHKTDVRSQLHLSGRRIAHGDDDGVHVGITQKYVQLYIDSTTK